MTEKRLDFIDLKAQQQKILPALKERIRRVLAHGQYILGPEVNELEERLAAYVGVRHAITCSSGTDALLMALLAYQIGPGDAIFTTPFTFIATAEVIQLLGATPVFVDIDPRTFNLDPAALEAAVASLGKNPRTAHLKPKGVIPVDLFGQPADYDKINAMAAQRGLFVLEDAAQSFGATYQGKRAGALAEVAATSFFPAKPLGGYGDGGAIFTDNDSLADILKSIRVHGQGANKYEQCAPRPQRSPGYAASRHFAGQAGDLRPGSRRPPESGAEVRRRLAQRRRSPVCLAAVHLGLGPVLGAERP